MKNGITIASALALCLSMAGQPAAANSDDAKKIAGALAILGVAALLHDKHHYHDGYQPQTDRDLANYERGFRDGLHNNRYDTRWGSPSYSHGFSAGQHERQARLSHHDNRQHGYNAALPHPALVKCVGAASNAWNVSSRDVHATRVQKVASQDIYVELVAGRHVGVCEVSPGGDLYQFRNGRL